MCSSSSKYNFVGSTVTACGDVDKYSRPNPVHNDAFLYPQIHHLLLPLLFLSLQTSTCQLGLGGVQPYYFALALPVKEANSLSRRASQSAASKLPLSTYP